MDTSAHGLTDEQVQDFRAIFFDTPGIMHIPAGDHFDLHTAMRITADMRDTIKRLYRDNQFLKDELAAVDNDLKAAGRIAKRMGLGG